MHGRADFKKRKQEQLQTVCRSKGLPVTVQRTVIMEALAGRKDHPTADQVYEQVKPLLAGVSRTTVYRVLEAFVAHGLAQKIGSNEAKARFDAEALRHHHLECVCCGAIIDLPHRASYDIPLPPSPDGLFQVLDYAIQFKGVCGNCRGESNPVLVRH
ncbi:transcriptional repressor [Geomonas sp.]|uniref:Fur family transcriptional regulator n=1 Tax=Geomonas sp. TaxID=2651584 RepID=UPI002B484118|nr:transcriptional repressor [Geomonas sp.]HJV33774.1 transcriptional repressor [Geomonas sp.]